MADQEEAVFLYVGTYGDEATAQSDYTLVKDELRRLAKQAWADWMPRQSLHASDTDVDADEIERAVLD